MSGRGGPASLLLGGLLTIAFGAFAVLTAIDMGWVGAVVLGVVLLLVAWRVPTGARVLPVVLAALGVVALVGAVVDLVT
ncbi:MAG TPA: hypothetical protein VFE07_01575 [Marmoricola sp.]|nr:hypothetical protein [Marmoricola sp.]